MSISNDYKLFLKFIDSYKEDGFSNVNDNDPLVMKLSEMMSRNSQFFYIGDMINMNIVYTCRNCNDIIDADCTTLDPRTVYSITHPDDIQRHAVTRSKLIKLCNELYISGDDFALMSTNLRYRNSPDNYSNILIQAYAFFSMTPVQTVYCLIVHTDIDWFGPIKRGYNYYIGKDMSYFRLPDEELILTGRIFTEREFEILNLIRQGLDSKSIGKKLFLSSHTVDTHRRNILKKTDKPSIHELIIDLQEKGFF